VVFPCVRLSFRADSIVLPQGLTRDNATQTNQTHFRGDPKPRPGRATEFLDPGISPVVSA
jgi:hypothetical protein